MVQLGSQFDGLSDPDRYGNRTFQTGKRQFEIRPHGSSVWMAHVVKPTGEVAKQPGAGLSVWKTNEETPEVLRVQVKPGYQGKGVASAMLHLAHQRYPNLSHSTALSPEGAAWAQRNPLPNDTEATKISQRRRLSEE